MLLIFRQLARNGDVGDDVEIAMAASVDVRHPFPAKLEPRACLGARWYVQLFAAVERGNLDGSAQSERREPDRQLTVQIVSFTMKEMMVLNVDDHVEVAGRA